MRSFLMKTGANMSTQNPSERIPLDFGLNCLPVTSFQVVSPPESPIRFDKVLACLYRFTSEGVFEVLSSSIVEGSFALLNTSQFDRSPDVQFCVWAVFKNVVVGRLGRSAVDLRLHGEEGTVVDGIAVSPVQYPDLNPMARTERQIYRLLNSESV